MEGIKIVSLLDGPAAIHNAIADAVGEPRISDDAPSPFLPGTNIQYAWDSTSLGWLKTCPRLYYYNMIEGYRGKGENIHLRFGIEYHAALQDYDVSRAAGIPHEDALHDTIRALVERVADWNPDPTEGRRSEELKTKDNLTRMVVWYLDKYQDDPAQTYIMGGGEPAVELSFRFELEWGPNTKAWVPLPKERQDFAEETEVSQPYLLCGHLDRVVNYLGDLYVMDHKTGTSALGGYYFNQFEPNNQMTLYTFAGQILFKSPIRGVIVDAAMVPSPNQKPGTENFIRRITYRTADQVEEWLHDLRYWLTLAEQYAVAGSWPMNDTACTMYGGCRFREACSKSPGVRDKFLNADFERGERWNPLKTR
jgi:hypothetical protein